MKTPYLFIATFAKDRVIQEESGVTLSKAVNNQSLWKRWVMYYGEKALTSLSYFIPD